MTDTDDLINDLQEYLEDKKPVYLRKLERLHPDKLIYRMLLVLEDMEIENAELVSQVKSLEAEIDELEYSMAELGNTEKD